MSVFLDSSPHKQRHPEYSHTVYFELELIRCSPDSPDTVCVKSFLANVRFVRSHFSAANVYIGSCLQFRLHNSQREENRTSLFHS